MNKPENPFHPNTDKLDNNEIDGPNPFHPSVDKPNPFHSNTEPDNPFHPNS